MTNANWNPFLLSMQTKYLPDLELSMEIQMSYDALTEEIINILRNG